MRKDPSFRPSGKNPLGITRAAVTLSLALLATACGSTSNKNLRNYAGQMKSIDYYKDFTDYENPNQSQPSEEAAEDNHDYYPDANGADPVTPGTTTPSPVTPSQPNAPSTTTPSDSVPAPGSGADPSTIPDEPNPVPLPAPAPKPAPSQKPAPVVITPPSQSIPTPPRRQKPAPAPAPSTDPSADPSTDKPQPGDCRLSDKPCFPVAGKVTYTDDFGARRSGGRRHAGNDIFAKKLTPVVAIEDGIVDRADRSASPGGGKSNNRLSGNYIGINHGNGVRTLYIHLNNDSPGTNDGQGFGLMPNIQVGVHVKKGQMIGWVGNSGNAETTPAHLHFEMRVTDDKAAVKPGHKPAYLPVDPYKMLKETEPNRLDLPMALNYR